MGRFFVGPVAILWLFFVGSEGRAQSPLLDSRLIFSQDLNIYQWRYQLKFEKLWSNQLKLRLTEAFHSTLQKVAQRDLWKDVQDFKLGLAYPLTPRLSVRSQFFSYMLSDPLAGFDNDLVHHAVTFDVDYRMNRYLRVTPQVSSKWQTQLEQSDQGFGLGLSGNADAFEISGYTNDVAFLLQRDRFPRRVNEDVRLRYRLHRQFYRSTTDTLRLVVDRLRRDTFATDGRSVFVRSLTQASRGIENRLNYRVSSFSSFYMRNSFKSTSFGVRNVKEAATEVTKNDVGFESDHFFSLRFHRPRWAARVDWHYRFRSREDRRPRNKPPDPFERHPTVGFDSQEVMATLSVQGGYRLAARDSLAVYASVSKFQFETTNVTIPNDHDLLKWQFTLSHRHVWSPSLTLRWQLSAFLNHFVFISSKFSSGNNWERVLQLTPVLEYRPSGRLSFTQGFTVRARYLTFDFDDPNTSNRNSVNRQFLLWNVLNLSLSRYNWLEAAFNLELAEQGKLFYDLWRQRLALSWRNYELRVLFRRRLAAMLGLAAGVNWFYQVRWNHRTLAGGGLSKVVRDKHNNVGPIVQVSYRPSRKIEILLFANIQAVIASGRRTGYINDIDVNVNWVF